MINTLADILKNASRSYGSREAYRYKKTTLSFQELDQRTNGLASFLQNSGVSKGDRVGIYLPRSLDSVIAVYGIMKAGAAFVPLDPQAPASRTAFLINDCNIRILISSESQSSRLSELLQHHTPLEMILGIDKNLSCRTVSWDVVNQSAVSVFPQVQAEDLAYIMYTSGSTGLPKGIMHTHRSGLNYAVLSAELYQLDHDDRVASHAPLHFDMSTFSYFTAPLSGACTVIIPEAYIKMPASLSALMQEERISVWYSVPLALIQLLRNGLLEQRDLSSMRWVLFGGEVFPPKFLSELMMLWPQATFCNVYGPAEVNQCTYYHLKGYPEPDSQIPLGKVWEEAGYKILDQHDHEVKSGETGELVVKTKSRMLGYWNNPNLTQKSLYQDAGSTYYRTGDLVKEDEHGILFFMGRNDRQIKLRGYRVELDEVEAVLCRHPQVLEAATFLMDDETGSPQLSAAIILVDGSALETSMLLAHCAGMLPGYAVPSRIEVLTEFPRTSSGKIKRSLLTEFINSKPR